MKKLIFTIITLLSVYAMQAQTVPSCNLLTCTWASTPQPNNPYHVTFTRNNPPPAQPSYHHQYSLFVSPNSGANFTSTQTSYNFPGPGTYNVAALLTVYDSTLLGFVAFCHDSIPMVVTISTPPCYTTITTVNNGSGSYTFTANNVGGGTGMSYLWNFGDGTTSTTSPATHIYTASGNYTVTLIATGSGCTSTYTSVVNYFNGTLNCSNLHAAFTASGTGYTKAFFNTSSQVNNMPPPTSVVRKAHWNFGDGSVVVNNNNAPSHTYASAGTYTVLLNNDWVDSNTLSVYCTDSVSHQITVTAAPNVIEGNIYWDSLNSFGTMHTFKVWLIEHDAVNNTLTAIDSTITTGISNATYLFSGHPAGSYRTKAATVAGNPGSNSLIPTYHDTSFYWNTATVITHTGGTTTNKNIHMASGTPSNGPGFVGGNISLGANKGTSSGIPNLLVVLRNTANQMVRFTYTDANGDYSFGNIPVDVYTVFPEEMNYITTPSSSLHLNAGSYTLTGVNFGQTATEIKPKATGVNNLPVSDIFSIYPNPAREIVQISWTAKATGEANILITDVTGRIVLRTDANTNTITKLDVSKLQAGMYMIKVTTDKAQHTQKLMLQK